MWLTSRGRVNPFMEIPAAGDPKHTLIKKGNVGKQHFKNHGPKQIKAEHLVAMAVHIE